MYKTDIATKNPDQMKIEQLVIRFDKHLFSHIIRVSSVKISGYNLFKFNLPTRFDIEPNFHLYMAYFFLYLLSLKCG